MPRLPRCGAEVLLLLLLSGCAQLPGFGSSSSPPLHLAKPPESFRLQGRVSVKSGEENFSGGMSWLHRPREETLLLSTPLGQGVAELHATPQGVSLTDAKGHRYQADDAEQLVRQVVGMTLPVKGLTWWVVGHPRPGIPFAAEAGAEGRLAMLQQDGWRIEFSRYAAQAAADGSALDLPGRLVARRGEDLEVRLVVDAWDLP
ncbi:MAG TPA: lipoprotein insertase outer membrane protein LolB [Thiobacillaceae bacterium]|nr:lipoprotein insertase outer membrane protein LolB [Thiobacillaceae bacterium]HNU64776.1 lipoprotein insertase outer membrane protein LolB [Thiobacillaceae bacterium]